MLKSFAFKLAILSLCKMSVGLSASASPCEESNFSNTHYRLYDRAYTALIEKQNPAAATKHLAKLTNKENLNCFEQGTALLLSSQIKRAQGDVVGSLEDLQTFIDKELGRKHLLLSARKSIYQIYLNEKDYDSGADHAEKWIEEGAVPLGDDALQLAVLFLETGRLDASVASANRKLNEAKTDKKSGYYGYLVRLHTVNSHHDKIIDTLNEFETFLNAEQMSDQDLSDGWGHLVSAYRFIKQDQVALDIMNMRVDRGDKLFSDSWNQLAHLNYSLGNFAEAVKWGEKLRVSDGQHTDVTLTALLHLAYDALGDTVKSKEYGSRLTTDRSAKDIITKVNWLPADAEVSPINPPVPSYPSNAALRGLEGDCKVFFDVDSTGVPFNIEAECSSDAFKLESERSVAEVRFNPFIDNGLPRNRRNVVYPLVYNLTD